MFVRDRNSQIFAQAERCRNGRLRNFFSYWDLLVGADQTDFGENRPAAQLRDEVVEVRNRVSAGLCDVVKTLVVSTEAPEGCRTLYAHVPVGQAAAVAVLQRQVVRASGCDVESTLAGSKI
ncbi:hypothetical protein T07_3789 [Trichinella nelsoni]|uniref:Uncharacterized protein n=1 Tax=Trichinella nelsoni TaxID=6336 RepID=A0A0V0S892_9BILA|nr:hypothetical protein T07_3789 [Trichinella nelsoni]